MNSVTTAQIITKRMVKNLAVRTPLRKWCSYRHTFQFTPLQLCFLCSELSRVDSDGSIVEIGCANGCTTVFLNKHMDAQQIDRSYHCIDTFGGFMEEDLRVERMHGRSINRAAFRTNDIKWFNATMDANSVKRVTAWEADASTFDYSTLAPIAFALVDVDLYRPVLNSLERLWPYLTSGGVIIVDDCHSGPWEGALAAYQEFCAKVGISEHIEHDKLGIVRRI